MKPSRRGERGGIVSKLLALLLLVVLLLGLYLFRRPILRAAGEYWVVEELPMRADAIVVLGDDNFRGERAARAAELFAEGWAPRVVASGRWLRPYAAIPDLIVQDLEARGVPREAIVRFPSSAATTYEEAQQLASLARQHNWRRLLVVTSNYHTRRTRFIFHKALGHVFEIRVVAAPDSDYDPSKWWHHRQSTKHFLHELVGYPVAWWEVERVPAPAAP